MIIVGIDAGLAHMGIAAVSYEGPESTLSVVHGIVVETKPLDKKHGVRKGDDNMRRAREVARALHGFLDCYDPAVLVYEAQSFGMKGQVAARQAGTAFGIIAAAAEQRGLPILCVQPAELKASLRPGVKGVSKAQIIDAVEELFPGQIEWPGRGGLWEHLADAIAVVWAARRDELLVAVARAGRAA